MCVLDLQRLVTAKEQMLCFGGEATTVVWGYGSPRWAQMRSWVMVERRGGLCFGLFLGIYM